MASPLTPTLKSTPPKTSFTVLSFPTPHVLLVTLNRPKQLNCVNNAGHHELHKIWTWLDSEPTLRVGIITGAGRAFCAGADLKESISASTSSNTPTSISQSLPPSGFGGIANRAGKKPIIAAVNGLAHGGGAEIVINCDIVLASPSAVFAFPEVKRGIAAIGGALPRLPKVVGRMRAMEMVLRGNDVDARKGKEWGFVNEIVEGNVVQEAVKWAQEIAGHSPDSVIVSKEGVEMGSEDLGVREATEKLAKGSWSQVENGENMQEGVRAFVEKRRPRWRDSKL